MRLLNFDWHNNFKNLGESETVDGLWSLLRDALMHSGFTAGTVQQGAHPTVHAVLSALASPKGHADEMFEPPPLWGYADPKSDPSATIATPTLVTFRQKGVLRYNCADSLDRTNLVTFFAGFQLLLESCRQLSIHVSVLPSGWEQRWEPTAKKHFFINHNKRETTWERPVQGGMGAYEWDAFDLSFNHLRVNILPSVLSALAELYVLSGDMASQVYTGSPALHTSLMRSFIKGGEAALPMGSLDVILGKAKKSAFSSVVKQDKMLSVASNTAISVNRRFQNMIYDNKRHAEMNAFLGYSCAPCADTFEKRLWPLWDIMK